MCDCEGSSEAAIQIRESEIEESPSVEFNVKK